MKRQHLMAVSQIVLDMSFCRQVPCAVVHLKSVNRIKIIGHLLYSCSSCACWLLFFVVGFTMTNRSKGMLPSNFKWQFFTYSLSIMDVEDVNCLVFDKCPISFLQFLISALLAHSELYFAGIKINVLNSLFLVESTDIYFSSENK